MRDNLGRFKAGTHWRKRKPHWDREWLYENYVVLGRSTGDMALDCGCTDANLLYWLRRHGIDRRTISQARALKHWGLYGEANPMHGKTGEANPRYVDGSSPERQRMYAQGVGREFIREALKRDEYKCQRCGAGKTKPKSLHIHHLKPWAGNLTLRMDLDNAVTLCRPCHSWVHSLDNINQEFLA